MCPGVLCDMREARHGGYTLALHSGVRVSEPWPVAGPQCLEAHFVVQSCAVRSCSSL